MPSDKPLPDRCGAAVTDKVGLEVHASELRPGTPVAYNAGKELDSVEVDLEQFEDLVPDEIAGRRPGTSRSTSDYDYHFDDGEIETVVLERDGGVEQVEEVPEFDEVMPYMRSGFELTAMYLELDQEQVDGAPDDTTSIQLTIEVDDEDPYVRNNGTELQGYCLRYPMDCGRCYVHGGATDGAGEGNTNAMTHGLWAKRTNFYNSRSQEDKEFIETMVDSWVQDAPFGRDNAAKVNELYRIAVDQLRLWYAVDDYVDENDDVKQLAYEQIVDTDERGNPIEAEEANPINLEYSRLDRDVVKKLEKLGCLDSPDAQKADAQASLAQKLSGLDDE